MKPNVVVDARGLFCPAPIVKTSEAIRVIDPGGILEVIADDPAIELDMRAWCASHGHKIQSVAVEGGVFRFLLKKSDAK